MTGGADLVLTMAESPGGSGTGNDNSTSEIDMKQCFLDLRNTIKDLAGEMKSLKSEVSELRENSASSDVESVCSVNSASQHTSHLLNSRSGAEDADTVDSEAAFMITGPSEAPDNLNRNDSLDIWETELNDPGDEGPEINERVAKVANSRFLTKLSESERKEKFAANLRPKNCPAMKVPILNEEVLDRANITQNAKRDDSRLAQVQTCISKAAAAAVNCASALHADLTDHVPANLADAKVKIIETGNKAMEAFKDITALLGTANVELSTRRRFQLQKTLPKEWAAICGNDSIPVTDKLFGDEVVKAINNAKESFKAKRPPSFSGQRNHPYQRKPERFGGGTFLGQGQGSRGTYQKPGFPHPQKQKFGAPQRGGHKGKRY